MKKRLSLLLAVLLLLSCMLTVAPAAQAEKATEKRAIAIVYDNSGSMYVDQNKAWCRATYAIEVFASMLNKGDILQIYPMNPFTLGENGDTVFSMQNPLVITNASDAYKIRDNYVNADGYTPIETIKAAADGLEKVSAEKKYLVIITDGATFHENNANLGKETQGRLNKEIENYAGNGMTVMYLGMDTVNSNGKVTAEACDPDIPESEHYVEKIVAESSKVLSALTEMCNIIFGRDTLPKDEEYFKNGGKTIELDISTEKLIVFVQGTNIDNLKITGDGIGNMVGTPQQTKYAENGNGWASFQPLSADQELQGMMVTYEKSGKGTFNIEYTGTASSVEVYYEPDVEMVFKFTDSEGNLVNPNELYEGDYTLEYGMIDGKDRDKYAAGEPVEYISSDLLGSCTYSGSYTHNKEKKTFSDTGFSGSEKIFLKKGDTFEADLEVEYLSGYRIYKSSKDFGWPEGGITVAPKPIAGYKLEITGGDSSYPLQQLEAGKPYKAVVYYEDKPLTGEELSKVRLDFNEENSNAAIEATCKEDHWELRLHHKDPSAPQNTKCGECTVKITAYYTPPKSDEAKKSANLTYNIKDDFATLGAELVVPEDYIVIKELEDSEEITVKLTLNGAPVSAKDFAAVTVTADCDGIEYELTPDAAGSCYKLKLLATDGLEDGDYSIKVNAQYTDSIGRTTDAAAESQIELSNIPMWVKWVITISILLLLFIIIWTILHIKVLPTKTHTTRRLSSMSFDGSDVTQSTNFLAEIKKGSAKVQGQYGGRKFGISMDVVPGKDSYLYKAQKRRSAEVKVASVRKFGPAKIQEAMVGSTKYVLDDDSGKLVPALPATKPFPLKNGMMVKFSGTIQDAGIDKDFEVTSKLNFKKK